MFQFGSVLAFQHPGQQDVDVAGGFGLTPPDDFTATSLGTDLLVEQNVMASLKLADRAYVLENGRIVLSGTGPELLDDDGVRQAYLGL